MNDERLLNIAKTFLENDYDDSFYRFYSDKMECKNCPLKGEDCKGSLFYIECANKIKEYIEGRL